MVMETKLTPKAIGMEFVRQYYTVLNESPIFLHRFYNNSSSFVHDGPTGHESEVLIGQKQIHQRIKQLMLKDCHTKIIRVDSQITLGDGIVIQVLGELSNAGQPMRRFTQTFVLGSQGHKKYYVHNDIFRYMDSISEQELNNEVPSLEDLDQNKSEEMSDFLANESDKNVMNGMFGINMEEISTTNQNPHDKIDPIQLSPPQLQKGDMAIVPVTEENQVPVATPKVDQELQQKQEESSPKCPILSQPQPAPQISLNGPKTYATLVKQGPTAAAGTVRNNNATQPSKHSVQSTSPPLKKKNEKESESSRHQINEYKFHKVNSAQRQPKNKDAIVNKYGDVRRKFFPDSHQVFVGNIPHRATVPELKEIFSQFGAIANLKILSKAGNQDPGMMKLPNYGFLIFEDVRSVEALFNSKPIYFPDENGVILNIEVKKARLVGEGSVRGRGNQIEGRGGGASPRGRPRSGHAQLINGHPQSRQ